MTTTSASRPINSSETFSYAAAASGKNSASSTPANKSQTGGLSKPTVSSTIAGISVSSASSSAQNMNGSPAPTTGTSTPQSTSAVDSHLKANGDATPQSVPPSNLGVGSTPTLQKEDESTASAPPVSEDKGNSWEKQSQTSSHTENKASSAGSRTPDASRAIDLVPAALPAVNFWKVRSEMVAKKPASTAAATATALPAKTPASPSNAITAKDNSDKSAEQRQDKRKKPLGEGSDAVEKERSREGPSGVKDASTREFRDRKKSTDAGRSNGFANKEDAVRKVSRKHQSQTEATPVLPPPVTDIDSWPTPEIAQDEVEKAKRDKDEKDKPVASAARSSKWVPVPITIPHIPPPFAGKSGRGRGTRGRDSSNRGGLNTLPSSSPNGEKHNGTTFGAGTGAEGDRGRQGPSPGASQRGYQAKTKRATSAGGTPMPRRDSKASLPPTSEKRKDSVVSPEGGEPAAEPSQSSKTASTGTQTHERVRQGSRSDNANLAPQGDGRHFSESQDRGHHINGHYHPRAERGYHNQNFNGNRSEQHGNDNASSHGPRERGFEGGRGRGHRARGNYHSQPYNGHNGAHHQNPGPHFTSTPSHFNAHQADGQYPAQNAQNSQRPFRPGSRSHQGANNGNYNRFPNPNMQPPPPIYMPPYPHPYDFSLISPTALPPPIEYTGIGEIIGQIEYYFSVDNLCKDMFLRKHMDSDGFVKLSLVAGFARMRNLTTDMNLLREACLRSREIDIAHGIDEFHVRKALGWETWVLNEKERDPSAQCDQSRWQIDNRQHSQPNSNSGSPLEMSGSAAPFMPGPSRSHSQNVIAPGAPPFVPSGTFVPGVYSTTPLSANVPEFSPNGIVYMNGTEGIHSVPDEFLIEDSQKLVVVTRRPGQTSPLGSPSMPRINGVISSSSSIANIPSFGFDSEVGWLLKEENQCLESDNYIHRLYPHALLQAQQQRESSGAAKNSEMITLYKFWSHFLCSKFNNSMYEDFRRYAFSDADASQRFGLECVYKFYENGLETREYFHDNLIQDLVDLARKDAKNGQSLGTEKLKSILSNPQLSPERKQRIESFVDPELHSVLQNGVEPRDGLVESYAA